LGDVKKVKGKEIVSFSSTQNTKRGLNANTLTPVQEEGHQLDGGDLKRSNLGSLLKNTLTESKVQNQQSMCDIVDIDDENPWLHPPENYAVAITGKAFNMLLNDPNQ
jgi:hypothetical protein